MADFNVVFPRMIKHEILANKVAWCKTPGDNGGETYAGIARVYHGSWKGWALLDKLQKKPKFGENSELDQLVMDFYRREFWPPVAGIVSNDLAALVFTAYVNMGTPALKILQRCVGCVDDGEIGPKTLSAVNMAKLEDLLSKVKAGYEARYRKIVAVNPTQQQFLKIWLSRLA